MNRTTPTKTGVEITVMSCSNQLCSTACWDWLPGGSCSCRAMTTPTTLSTAQAMISRIACVRLGRITRLLDDQKAGHVAHGLHRTAVAVDGARPAGDEALPVVDAGLAGFEGERDHVHAARRCCSVHTLERHEHTEVRDGKCVGSGRRVGD